MKILLIANYEPDEQQSMLRYARMLQKEIAQRGHDVSIVQPKVVLGAWKALPGALRKWLGYIDKYILSPHSLRAEAAKADIVHICDHSNAMYLKCARNRPALITCHDLLAVFAARGMYAGVTTGGTGRILQRWIARSIMRAEHIVSVSAKTQRDLDVLEPGLSSKSVVIRHPLNWNYAPASSEEIAQAKHHAGLAPNDEYFLHVGGNQWYKNRLGALKIFAELKKLPRFQETRMVMAGKPWTPSIRDFAIANALTGSVIECRSISNETLQGLYSGALALLFPSLEEGFGWPILEAQACGCPVITTNRPPMTEIAGNAAIFIDPANPQQAAREIHDRESDLDTLRIAGFSNLSRFEKDRAISAYLDFYERVMQSRSTTGYAAPRSA